MSDPWSVDATRSPNTNSSLSQRTGELGSRNSSALGPPRQGTLDGHKRKVTVPPGATLLDLPNAPPEGSNLQLAARKGGDDGQVVLRWSRKSKPPESETALARQVLAQMVDNSASQVSPQPGTKAVLDAAKHSISSRRLTRGVVRELSDSVFRSHLLHDKPSRASDQPRVPTECVAAWLDQLDQAAAGAHSSRVGGVLQQLTADARARWMKHDLSVPATRQLLEQAAAACSEAGLGGLAEAARTLLRELERHEGGSPPLTRLHDNLNGRVWESSLVNHLVENMPQPVIDATRRLGMFVAREVKAIPPDTQWRFLDAMKATLKRQERWAGQGRDTQLVKGMTDPHTLLAVLGRRVLAKQLRNGRDVVTLQMWCAKIAQALEGADVARWASKASYTDDFKANRARRRFQGTKDAAVAGITLAHQPAAIRKKGMSEARRPGDEIAPDHDRLKDVQKAQLQGGAPYVTDLSGSVLLMKSVVDHAKEKGDPINADHAMLGAFIAYGYDGGHSLHECLWSLDKIDTLHGGEPKFGRGGMDAYVSDYGAFFQSFQDAQVKTALGAALDAAWSGLTDYRKKHIDQGDVQTASSKMDADNGGNPGEDLVASVRSQVAVLDEQSRKKKDRVQSLRSRKGSNSES